MLLAAWVKIVAEYFAFGKYTLFKDIIMRCGFLSHYPSAMLWVYIISNVMDRVILEDCFRHIFVFKNETWSDLMFDCCAVSWSSLAMAYVQPLDILAQSGGWDSLGREEAVSKDGLFSFAQLLPSADSMRKCSSMKIMGWNLCRFGKVWK